MPDLGVLGSLPRDEDEPVFVEPWQAHAFALAVKLSEAGVFSWSEWAVALGAELAAAAKNIIPQPMLLAREEEWAAAYRRTPHGSPVTLSPKRQED
jgi:hypothetical protein